MKRSNKNIEMNDLRTRKCVKREARDLAIYNEYNELVALPGAMKMEVVRRLMRKYDIEAQSTIWFIRKKVEKRLSIN